ncbi:C-type mannose receptor 2 [Hyalella azteca]|uniref:C-type mannose receptor 2 n=1 Tax=Hyalella azteca TaxID=294128 RepID=A0A8B7P046_HYAAZ|nr:C-type mannose receptor 2 [Hyalella azteca]
MQIICLLMLVLGTARAECPSDYEVVGSKCIHRLIGGYLTYDNAVTYCHEISGRLPVLPDCATFTNVAAYVDDGYSADAYKGYWLGATSPSANGVWQWSDGSVVAMGAPYWAYHSRNGSLVDPCCYLELENCAYIEPGGGWVVQDATCDNERETYPLCSKAPIDGICDNPYVLVGTQCVHIIPSVYHWLDARSQCALIGGDLITLKDCDQYHRVYLYLDEQSHDPLGYWIGASDEVLEGQWRWIDGSSMSLGLPYWGTNGEGPQEPDNPGVENCLEMSSEWMYRFSSTACNNVRRVICEADPI